MKDTYLVIDNQHKRAYDTFSRVHEREFPQPHKPSIFTALPVLIFPVIVIALSGLGLSSLRTAPVFQQIAKALVDVTVANVEAILAVLIVEFAVLVYRIANLIIEYNRTGKIPDITAWVKIGFWSAFGILVASNIYASVGTLPVLSDLKPVIDFVMGLLVAVAAPLLAFVSGDIMASLWVSAQEKRQMIFGAWKLEHAQWKEIKDGRWKNEKSKWGVKVQVKVPELPSGEHFTKVHENREMKRTSPAPQNKRVKLHEVAREIHENGDVRLSTEDMMKKYNISMGSTSKVREILKAKNGNGYHQ